MLEMLIVMQQTLLSVIKVIKSKKCVGLKYTFTEKLLLYEAQACSISIVHIRLKQWKAITELQDLIHTCFCKNQNNYSKEAQYEFSIIWLRMNER